MGEEEKEKVKEKKREDIPAPFSAPLSIQLHLQLSAERRMGPLGLYLSPYRRGGLLGGRAKELPVKKWLSFRGANANRRLLYGVGVTFDVFCIGLV